jgi:3-phosphoshikimate 1-carboxyvinyltransferase
MSATTLSVRGVLDTLPPDKSISHRAALIAALARGTSHIENFSAGFDNQTTLHALRQVGVEFEQTIHPDGRRSVVIRSNGLWSLKPPSAPIECNNSGSTMRMLSGILAAQPFSSTLLGDASLMRRPMRRIAEPLSKMGAKIELSAADTAPIHIHGSKTLQPISYASPIASAQVKSAIILAALHADGISEVIEPARSRNHTELMLGLETETLSDGRYKVKIKGQMEPLAQDYVIPADPSAACFIIAFALLASRSELVLKNVCLNPTRAAYLDLLRAAGAALTIENLHYSGSEPIGDIVLSNSSLSSPLNISGEPLVACIIDEIPMLAVLSALATERFSLSDAKELRTKESDRIAALVLNLRALGFACEEYADGFRVLGREKIPTTKVRIDTFHDHRIAMSFHIASYFSGADLALSEQSSVSVSFPNFFQTLQMLIHS